VCNTLLVPSAEFLSGNSLVPSPPASNRRWPRPEAALPVIEGGVGSQVRQFIGFGIYQVDGVIVAGWPKKKHSVAVCCWDQHLVTQSLVNIEKENRLSERIIGVADLGVKSISLVSIWIYESIWPKSKQSAGLVDSR